MSPLASTSSASVSFIEESIFGVLPTSPTTSKSLRVTGADLSYEGTSIESKELNSTRQTQDSVLVSTSALGGINFELSYRMFDPFLEALLASTFTLAAPTDGVIDVTATSVTAATGVVHTSTVLTGLPAVPFWAHLAGDGLGGNKTVEPYLITAVNSGTSFTVSASTPFTVNNANGGAITISNSRISNGTAAQRSFCIQKAFADVSQYFLNRGRVPVKLDLNLSIGSALTGTFGFIGKDEIRYSSSQMGTLVAAPAYGMISGTTGVGYIGITDGAAGAGTDILGAAKVLSMKVSIDAAGREQKALGELGAAGIGTGKFKIGGTAEIYLANGLIYDEAINDRLCSVLFPVFDTDGNGYGFIFDNVKFKIPKVVAGSIDSDVTLSVEFTAVAPNTATDKMIHIDRFGAAIS